MDVRKELLTANDLLWRFLHGGGELGAEDRFEVHDVQHQTKSAFGPMGNRATAEEQERGMAYLAKPEAWEEPAASRRIDGYNCVE